MTVRRFGAAAAAALALAQGCGSTPPASSAPDPIVIGVSLGLTNALSVKGVASGKGIQVAEGVINAGGGLLGRPVKFQIVDDRSDEGDGVAAVVRAFAATNVAAVIGPVGSLQVKASQQILADAKILQITPTAQSPDFGALQPAAGRFLFRTVAGDDLQAAAVIAFAKQRSCAKLAVAYVDNADGSALAQVVIDKYPLHGGAIATSVKVPAAAAAYADVATTIFGSQPTCLAVIADDRTGAQLVKDVKANASFIAADQAGFFIVGTDGLFTKPFLDLSETGGVSTAVGVYGTNADIPFGSPDFTAFRALYASYFPLPPGEDTPPYAANAFDAAVLVALAIQKAGGLGDRVAIRDAVKAVSAPGGTAIGPAEIVQGLHELREGRDVDYRGASGPVDLKDDGTVGGGFLVWHVERDKTSNKVVFQIVSRLDNATLQELVR